MHCSTHCSARIRYRYRLAIWALTVWGLASGGSWANAPEASAGGAPEGPARPVFIQVRYVPSFQLERDFSQAEGSVSSHRQDLTGTLVVFLPRYRGRLLLSGSHDWLEFRFRDNEILAGRLEAARNAAFSAVYMGALTEDWSIFAMSSVQSAAERGASLGEDVAVGGNVQAQYQLRDDLEVGVGLMIMDHWDEGMRVFPVASVDWRATERLRIRTTRGLNVGYQLDDRGRWTAGWNTEFFSSYIRLNDEGEGAGGIFRSRAVVSTLSLLYQPNPGMTFGAELGTSLWRSLRIRDPDRQTIFQSRTDRGLSGALIASLTF